MDLDSLPAEMLLHVLSYLEPNDLCQVTGQVCRQWQALSYDYTLWRNIKLDGHDQSQHEILRLIENSSALTLGFEFLNISDWRFISALPKCSHLRKIQFNTCSLNRSCISKLVAALPLVENVCLTTSEDLDCKIVREIVRWTFLKVIKIDPGNNVSRKILDGSYCLSLLTNKCKNLENLHMGLTLSVDDRSVTNFAISQGAKLKALTLNMRDLSSDGYSFLTHCFVLKDLYIFMPHNMSANTLLNLTLCRVLEKLAISAAMHFTADHYVNIFESNTFPSLLKLSLYECSCLTDRALELLSLSCPALKQLDLTGCTQVTDAGVIHVINNSRNMEALTLLGLRINGSCFAEICKLSKLTFLDLTDSYKVKNDVLMKLREHNPQLHVQCKD